LGSRAWLAIGVLIGVSLGIFAAAKAPWIEEYFQPQEPISADASAAKLDRLLRSMPEYKECAGKMDAHEPDMMGAVARTLRSPYLPDDPDIARAYVIERCVDDLMRQHGKLE
jgi:hypothetical protein